MFGMIWVNDPNSGTNIMCLERQIGQTYWLLTWREWYEQAPFLRSRYKQLQPLMWECVLDYAGVGEARWERKS